MPEDLNPEIREELDPELFEIRDEAPPLRDGDDDLTPITREETFLAAIAGEEVTVPDPVIRKEEFLAAIDAHIGDVEGDVSDLQAADALMLSRFGSTEISYGKRDYGTTDSRFTIGSNTYKQMLADYSMLRAAGLSVAEAATEVGSRLELWDTCLGKSIVSSVSSATVTYTLSNTVCLPLASDGTLASIHLYATLAINLAGSGDTLPTSSTVHGTDAYSGNSVTVSDYTSHYYDGSTNKTGREIFYSYRSHGAEIPASLSKLFNEEEA